MDRKIVELLIQGTGVNEIVRHLHIAKGRVRHLRKLAVECGYLDKDGHPGKTELAPYPERLFPEYIDGRTLHLSESHRLLEPHRSWIEERLRAGWHLITVYEELPVKGISRSSFYRYLTRHKLNRMGKPARVIPEIIHKPAEALLLDWGRLCSGINPHTGKKMTVWAFVGVLGFSRYMMVRLVWTNDSVTTLKAIEGMFHELGGVPHSIISDNPKCFSLIASKYEPLLNPAFERFASHFGVVIDCLPPRDPQKKGKVERPIPYIRRLFEAHGEWHGLEEAQEYLKQKLIIANDRKHGTTLRQPKALYLEEEKPYLKNLPGLAYEVEEFHEGRVRKDGHIRFQNKYYSVDEKFVDEDVVILGDSKQVCIYHKGKLLEVHPRITDRYQAKSTKPQHLKPWERSLEDHSGYRTRAAKLGPHVEEVIVAILKESRGFIDTRKIWGILSLDKRYSAEAINHACKEAIQLDSVGYRTIKGLLEIEETNEIKTIYESIEKPARQTLHRFLNPLSDYEQMSVLVQSAQDPEFKLSKEALQ